MSKKYMPLEVVVIAFIALFFVFLFVNVLFL